jgi:hypothetical protein
MPELYHRVSFDYQFSEEIRKSNAGHDWYNKEAHFRLGELFTQMVDIDSELPLC